MTTFILTVDLADHVHDSSERAHRHILCGVLGIVAQKVGSTGDLEGEITHGQAFAQKVIGSWKFLDAATDNPAEELKRVLKKA